MFPVMSAGNPITGYNINNSLRFRSSASAYLSRTPSSTTNQRTWTWSAWVKRGSLGSYQVLFGAGLNNNVNADYLVSIYFTNTDQIGHYVNETGVADRNNYSTAVFRDPSAWYHIVAIYDSTQATAANRQRLFVNGVEITSWAATSYVSQNFQASVNSTSYPHAIGKYGFNGTRYFDGYMTEVNFIDGQALTPSSFGATDAVTGQWLPKQYSGTYGTNGFYLKFSDIATTSGSNAGLGKDFSGNGNYWTTNNISVTSGTTYDAMTDSPTLTSTTVANYCVLNPVLQNYGGAPQIADGNLKNTAGANYLCALGTIGVSSGKYYWEVTLSGNDCFVGISAMDGNNYNAINPQNFNGSVSYYLYDGNKRIDGTVNSSYGATATTGDIIGVALDATNKTITFYKNNTSQGAIDYSSYGAGTKGTVNPFLLNYNNNSIANFGQRPFTYTPPTGYLALNTYNLPTPTIKAGNKYMDATAYTGDGTSPKSRTNTAGFQPDLVWIKNRTSAYSHNIYDSVRAAGSSKNLQSDTTGAEGVSANLYGYLSAFNSNGFQTTNGTDATNPSIWANTNGSNFVAWQWQAGSGTTSSNTSGSITSTVSVNTTAGFSICSYTAPAGGGPFTVGHGLGVAPKFIIVKNRDGATDEWAVYHDSLGNTKDLVLNSTVAAQTLNFWNSTSPTSTVFSIGTRDEVDRPNNKMIAYCWAEIAGFSKFGSYTGNGSTDGTFIYLGFRPKFLMVKSTSGNSWEMLDTSRNTYNAITSYLEANNANAEATYTFGDALSNGFKFRDVGASLNASGTTYIYAAFAENPFKYANAR